MQNVQPRLVRSIRDLHGKQIYFLHDPEHLRILVDNSKQFAHWKSSNYFLLFIYSSGVKPGNICKYYIQIDNE